MLRSEIPARATQEKALLEECVANVRKLLKRRSAEVLTLHEIVEVLYPGWDKMKSDFRDAALARTVSAIYRLISAKEVEETKFPGTSDTYYGIKL